MTTPGGWQHHAHFKDEETKSQRSLGAYQGHTALMAFQFQSSGSLGHRLCCLAFLGQAPDRPWKMGRDSQAPQPCQSNGLLMSQAKEYLSWWRGLDEGGGALGHVLQLAEGQDSAVRPTGRAWDGLPLEMGEGVPTARRGRAHGGWARAGPHKCQEGPRPEYLAQQKVGEGGGRGSDHRLNLMTG